jgi:acyl dehydratase
MLGRFLISPFFPVNPMGLIQTGQSFTLMRPVYLSEPLDLCCSLAHAAHTPRGVEFRFCLEILSDREQVWQGVATYLARDPNAPGRGKKQHAAPTCRHSPQKTIHVPLDTGRQYARVSGDFNPHHLYRATARIFGFNTPIAHGMWSLARVTAVLEAKFTPDCPVTVSGAFKRPVFMPAILTLGYGVSRAGQVDFELRDQATGVPHLTGQYLFKEPLKPLC